MQRPDRGNEEMFVLGFCYITLESLGPCIACKIVLQERVLKSLC